MRYAAKILFGWFLAVASIYILAIGVRTYIKFMEAGGYL